MDAETDEQAWARRAAGSISWFKRTSHGREAASDLTPETLDMIVALRERLRRSEGGGGLCHVVSEVLENKRGWTRHIVGYLGPDGAMACASHYVNVLGDGTLVDSTADQFGEGHDVRIVSPGDPEYGRYRPDFGEDFNPGTDPVALSAWLPDWKGMIDDDAQDLVDEELGPAWWLDDPTPRLEFLRTQLGYMEGIPDGKCYRGRTEVEIEAIEERLRQANPSP